MWFIAITSLECIIFLQYFFLLLPKAGLCNQKLDGKTLLGIFLFSLHELVVIPELKVTLLVVTEE